MYYHILYEILKCQLLKIETIVLRICRRLYQCFDCNRKLRLVFSDFSFNAALYLLDHRRNSKEITNENLYNGTAILKFDWVRKNFCGLESYVDTLVNVVIICISRFQDLHAAATHRS